MAVRKLETGYELSCSHCGHVWDYILPEDSFQLSPEYYDRLNCARCVKILKKKNQLQPNKKKIPVRGPGIGVEGIREMLKMKRDGKKPL